MPVIKSAKKKLRKDRKLTLQNRSVKNLFKKAIKDAEKSPTEKTVREATKIIDKTAKKNIIHKNKASRIKSVLSKLLLKSLKTKTPTKTKKTSSKK